MEVRSVAAVKIEPLLGQRQHQAADQRGASRDPGNEAEDEERAQRTG